MGPPDDMLDAASDAAWHDGLRVLQGCRLAPDDGGHVGTLLRLMHPPLRARIADVGCGFGEVARLMRAAREDLSFVLVNRNASQLARCPAGSGFELVRADMHALPLGDRSVDGCMFLYTLCHADIAAALTEAARVTRRGGFLFVYDYERRGLDDGEAERVLYARFHQRNALIRTALGAGWVTQWTRNPEGDDSTFRRLFLDADAYARIFDGLHPLVWRAYRA